MGRSGRLFLLVRPYALLFVANLVATFVASVLDGATFVLLIPFLRTLFGLAPLPELGGSSVERLRPGRLRGHSRGAVLAADARRDRVRAVAAAHRAPGRRPSAPALA